MPQIYPEPAAVNGALNASVVPGLSVKMPMGSVFVRQIPLITCRSDSMVPGDEVMVEAQCLEVQDRTPLAITTPGTFPRLVDAKVRVNLSHMIGEPINEITKVRIKHAAQSVAVKTVNELLPYNVARIPEFLPRFSGTGEDVYVDHTTVTYDRSASSVSYRDVSWITHDYTPLTSTDQSMEVTVRLVVNGTNSAWADTMRVPMWEKPFTLAEKVSIHIKKNLTPEHRKRQGLIEKELSTPEQKARETLREMITETEWRRYVTNGFLMVKGASGRWYQLFRSGKGLVKVWEKGKHINSICIHSDSSVPPTDHVINMKVLVEVDEESVWKGGNIRNAMEPHPRLETPKKESTNLLQLVNPKKIVTPYSATA